MDSHGNVDLVSLMELSVLDVLKLPFASPKSIIIMIDQLISILFSGCYFQEGEEVKMEMSVESAFQRSIQTLVEWIDKEVNLRKTHVLFRSYAPVHFRFVSSLYISQDSNNYRYTLQRLGSLGI